MCDMCDLASIHVDSVEAAIGIPFDDWAQDCHTISLAIVKSKLLPVSRVARGACKGVGAQHSWVVVGNDCYDADAIIVDPTLWSYDDSVKGIWMGSARDGRHVPHGGTGTIWQYGQPPPPEKNPIALATPISKEAELFLELCGPLDDRGWAFLAHAPIKGWPCAEIIAAMDDTPALRALVPVDILGMVTDRNPGGGYLPGAEHGRL